VIGHYPYFDSGTGFLQ